MKNLVICLFCAVALCGSAFAEWRIDEHEDVVTGEKWFSASSNAVESVNPMKFPYEGIKSAVSVGCDSSVRDERRAWISFYFDGDTNLNYDLSNGAQISDVTMRYGENSAFSDNVSPGNNEQNLFLARTGLPSEVNQDDIKFFYKHLKLMMKHDPLVVKFNWHQNNNAVFKYDLRGAAEKIQELYSKCWIATNDVEEWKIDHSHDDIVGIFSPILGGADSPREIVLSCSDGIFSNDYYIYLNFPIAVGSPPLDAFPVVLEPSIGSKVYGSFAVFNSGIYLHKSDSVSILSGFDVTKKQFSAFLDLIGNDSSFTLTLPDKFSDKPIEFEVSGPDEELLDSFTKACN